MEKTEKTSEKQGEPEKTWENERKNGKPGEKPNKIQRRQIKLEKWWKNSRTAKKTTDKIWETRAQCCKTNCRVKLLCKMRFF